MNARFRIFYGLWLIAASIVGSPQPAIADTPVTLRGPAEVRGYAIRLGDLFAGVPADIDRDIAQAPAPCKTTLVDANALSKLAHKYRLDWQPQTISDHAQITSACVRITADMVRDAIAEKIKDTMDMRNRKIEVALDARNLEIDLPADSVPDFSIVDFTYDPLLRHVRGNVTVATTGGPVQTPVAGHVTVRRSVPVLARRLEAGTIISASDLVPLDVSEERLNSAVVTETAQLVGRELRRDSAEGDIIHANDVMAPRLVQRGSLVTIKVETPVMIVTSQGRAQQDGAEGETVRVMNTQSNRIVEGKVTGAGTVSVTMYQKVAALP